MLFYNFNFKGRWHEFKIFFPKRWDSFKTLFHSTYIEDDRWTILLADYLMYWYGRLDFYWFAFVLNYRLMAISVIRKMFSYSRMAFYWGFDFTKVFYVTDLVSKVHEARSIVVNGIERFVGLGFDSSVRSKLYRSNLESANITSWNFDYFILPERKIYNRGAYRAYYTFFYYTRRAHRFLLLTESPWPLFASFSAFYMVLGLAAYFNFYEGSLYVFWLGFFSVIFTFYSWCRDFLRETNLFARLTDLMIQNIKLGFWLFITTEALLFVSFFWAFFHVSLEPAIQLGSIWPPVEGIQMDKLLVPTANTLFLLASGAAFTWVQYHYLAGLYIEVVHGFALTILFSIFFLFCQWHEYVVSAHQINDSVFGSTLYLLTGFHGAHVLIGSIFIIVCFWRFYLGHFVLGDPAGITLAAWYWHFVDVVWLLVFIWVYLWGTWIPAELALVFQAGFYS